jgi:hypothetical protein
VVSGAEVDDGGVDIAEGGMAMVQAFVLIQAGVGMASEVWGKP